MLSIAVCTIVMLAIRAYAFTIFTVPDEGLKPVLRKGDRVLVNRLARTDFKRGEVVLFGQQQQALGQVMALPGDTITVKGEKYLIPNHCNAHCHCGTCQYLLLGIGRKQTLVQQGDIAGKAYSLFRWKRWTHLEKHHE